MDLGQDRWLTADFRYSKTTATLCHRLNSGISLLLARITVTELCKYSTLQKLVWTGRYINKTNMKHQVLTVLKDKNLSEHRDH